MCWFRLQLSVVSFPQVGLPNNLFRRLSVRYAITKSWAILHREQASMLASDGTAIKELTERVRQLRDRTVAEVGRVVVGMEHVTQRFLIALLASGHVLLEGVPGVAKTTLSKTFAHILGIQYHRLQFTPDLLPSDVTGTFIFDRNSNDFVLRKGPIFCLVLLAD
jgi:MoxR-like ATPase